MRLSEDLPIRVYDILRQNGIDTQEEFYSLSDTELMKFRRLKGKTLELIHEYKKEQKAIAEIMEIIGWDKNGKEMAQGHGPNLPGNE
jgi:DNA-directed RNA polymerase alpha subunit